MEEKTNPKSKIVKGVLLVFIGALIGAIICGIATGNITLKNKKPVWGKHCTHCMACICYCPAEAIEYGRKSVGKPRYCFENLGLEKYDYSNPLK